MSHFKRRMGVFVFLAAALASLACSVTSLLPGAAVATATTPPEAAVVKPTQTVVQLTATIKSTISAAANNSTPAVSALKKGLDKLDSYKMVYSITIDGVDENGKPTKQNMKLVQEIVKSKDSSHLFIQGNGFDMEIMGSSVGTDGMDFFQLAKTGYLLMPSKDNTAPSCISFASDKPAIDTTLLLTPESMVGDLQAQSIIERGKSINGVRTDHYQVQNSVLSFGTATAETGEMWVSQDNGYLVRYSGMADGEFTLTTSKVKGRATFSYDLTNVNLLKEITLPETCRLDTVSIQDLPVPANATEQGTFAGIFTFSSPDTPKVVAAFYRKQLVVKGWKITSDTDMGTVSMISISKDTRKFQIMIALGTNNVGTSVVVTKLQ
jgi:hypothetical protein